MAGLVFFLSTDPGGDFCGDVGGVFTPLPRASDGVEGGVSTTTVWRYAAETAGGMGAGGGGHNLRAQVPWKGEVAMRRDLYSHYLRALGGRELLPSHGFVYPTWFVRVYPLVSKCGRHGGAFEARGARIPRDSGVAGFLFSSVSSPADSKVVGCACARQEPPLLRWH